MKRKETKEEELDEDEDEDEEEIEEIRIEKDPTLMALIKLASEWTKPFISNHLHLPVDSTKIEAGFSVAKKSGVNGHWSVQ